MYILTQQQHQWSFYISISINLYLYFHLCVWRRLLLTVKTWASLICYNRTFVRKFWLPGSKSYTERIQKSGIMLSLIPRGMLSVNCKDFFFSFAMVCQLGVPSPLAWFLLLSSSCLLNSCWMWQPGALETTSCICSTRSHIAIIISHFKRISAEMSCQLSSAMQNPFRCISRWINTHKI